MAFHLFVQSDGNSMMIRSQNALLQTEHLQLCNMHEKSTRINGEESSSWTRNGITVLGSSGITGLDELSQNILQFSIICKLVTELTEILRKN